MYIHVYIFMYMYIYTYIYTYMCTHIQSARKKIISQYLSRKPMYMCIYTYTYIFTCIHVYIHVQLVCGKSLSAASIWNTSRSWWMAFPMQRWGYDLFIGVTWFVRMCDMPRSYVRHDSFTGVTWLMHMCDMTHSYVWLDSAICVTGLIHMCDLTHSYVRYDSFICVTRLIHMRAMTHAYVRGYSSICVPWLIYRCDKDSFISEERIPWATCQGHFECRSIGLICPYVCYHAIIRATPIKLYQKTKYFGRLIKNIPNEEAQTWLM